MSTQVTARHFQASPHLQAYALQRIDKLNRFYNGITDAHVVLAPDADTKSAELTLNVFRQRLTARTSGSSYEEAIDGCTERMRRQILRYKAKLRRNKQVDRFR